MANHRLTSKGRVDARYRALLEFSSATASEPNLQAVLHKTSALLSRIIPSGFWGTALLLLEEESGLARLHALERGSEHLAINLSLEGTAIGLAIDEQRPVLVEDGQAELKKFPELATYLKGEPICGFHVFPVSTSGRGLGALVVAMAKSDAFSEDDVKLMAWVASQLSLVLDRTLAFESAGEYRRELVRERDRLKLLIEINNHVVSRLEIDEFFRAASASIRQFFRNDFTGFWLLDEQSKRLNCAV